MTADRVAGLFDVGFAAKGRRIGMGLGLPAARRIVQAHYGRIEVDRDTVVSIRLPVHAAANRGPGELLSYPFTPERYCSYASSPNVLIRNTADRRQQPHHTDHSDRSIGIDELGNGPDEDDRGAGTEGLAALQWRLSACDGA